MLGKFSKEEFIQALNEYASSKEASDDQKEQISRIILGISNKELYFKFLKEEQPSVIDITLKTPLADNLITCLSDAVEYQRRRVLFKDNLEALKSLVAVELTNNDRKPPKKPLPRPPKIIKLNGGKK